MTVPEGYEMPTGVTGNDTVYAIAEQPGDSATDLFMVVKISPGMQEIMAEKSYLGHAVAIVDALRLMNSR